jgi:hypothetical protein
VKRWTVRILLCLILGAITTVAVAWGVSLAINPTDFKWTGGGGFGEKHESDDFSVSVYEYGPSLHRLRVINQAIRMGRDSFVSPPDVPELTPLEAALIGKIEDGTRTRRDAVALSGWPSHAMQLHHELDLFDVRASSWSLHLKNPTIDNTGRIRLPTALPLCPLWPGLVIDTLFYAAIWFGVFFAQGMAKRAIRRKRGRCPRCGYDLRGHRHEGTPGEPRRHEGLAAGCPECGWGRE